MMSRQEMWDKARDWRTPPEEKKRLLQQLHQGPRKGVGVPAGRGGCSKCKKRLR